MPFRTKINNILDLLNRITDIEKDITIEDVKTAVHILLKNNDDPLADRIKNFKTFNK